MTINHKKQNYVDFNAGVCHYFEFTEYFCGFRLLIIILRMAEFAVSKFLYLCRRYKLKLGICKGSMTFAHTPGAHCIKLLPEKNLWLF